MKSLYTIFASAAALFGSSFAIQAAVNITESKGWLESCYVVWDNNSAWDAYHVYVKAAGADWTKLDDMLVRDYDSYGRADALGLKAGKYQMKVVPVISEIEQTADAQVTGDLEVKNYDRAGFAHFNWLGGIGAYNNDGTLKEGAKVFYVTSETAKTISTDVIVDSKGKTQTFTGIQAILTAYQKEYDQTPIAFRIVGKLTSTSSGSGDLDSWGSSAEGLQVKGKSGTSPMNITIEGVGNDATCWGFGFLIRNACSVEFRNFGIMCFKDDALSFDTNNQHCWAHHIDLFYGNAGGDSDQAKGDGSIDVKGNSKYMTFSYNHFWDSGKASLCGLSESGPNYISYHHNWFDHSDSRHARVRTMSVHIYNNYYDGVAKYGVGAAKLSDVFVEKNYFRNCPYPMLSSNQGSDISWGNENTFSGETGGIIKSQGNIMTGTYTFVPYGATSFVRSGSTVSEGSELWVNTTEQFDAYDVEDVSEKVPSSVVGKSGGHVYNNFDTNSSLMYTYTPDAAADVPSIVTGFYGAGRLNHGDFQWEFNADDDKSYAVNTALKSAVVAYTSTLKGWYGSTNTGSSEQGTESEEGTGSSTGGSEEGGDSGDSGESGGSSESGGSTGGSTIGGSPDWDCFFTYDEKVLEWTSGNYEISGNGSTTKGTCTVNGETYSICLKVESSTKINFTLPEAGTFYVYFGNQDTKFDLKVDDVKYTGEANGTNNGGLLKVDLQAGSHTVTKASTGNIFYMTVIFPNSDEDDDEGGESGDTPSEGEGGDSGDTPGEGGESGEETQAISSVTTLPAGVYYYTLGGQKAAKNTCGMLVQLVVNNDGSVEQKLILNK